MSYWEDPQRVELTYLTPGRYYAYVRESSTSPDSFAQPYTIAATRTPGAPCESPADCAAEFRNQIYRGNCQGGACVDLDGGGTLVAGDACDSQSDCAAGLECSSFFFVDDASTRDVCEPTCTNDAQCGAGYVCTTYLDQNFCVARCTGDLDCPVVTNAQPQSGPWARLSCQVSTGRCRRSEYNHGVDRASASILVVEDDAAMRDLLTEELGDAASPCKPRRRAAGLELARGGRFDLIITDLRMPEMDGFDLIRGVIALPDCARRTS